MDAPRTLLVATLARRPDLDLRKLSRAIGRNQAYLQQYLVRGVPRELPEAVRQALAPLLGVQADDLRSDAPRIEQAPEATAAGSPPRPEDGADLPVYATR